MTRKPPLPSALVMALWFASTTLGAAPARAEEPVSPSRQLFAEARRLMAEGKHAEACPKLEESLKLEGGIGTQFNLAECWEHIGRTASAQALFLAAAEAAKAAGQSEREQVLRDRAAALETRLSRLVIEVKATDEQLSVERNDLPIGQDAWGKAIALDPGSYTIRARAAGKRDWEKLVDVTPATSLTTVHVPELEPLTPTDPTKAGAKDPPKPEAASPQVPASAPVPAETDSAGRAQFSPAVLAVAGVGVAALTVGTVMGLRYLKANSDSRSICPSNRDCTLQEVQAHTRLVDDARTARAWSYAGFGVGAASLVGAGWLWYSQRPRTTAGISWQAAPIVATDGSYGAALTGSF